MQAELAQIAGWAASGAFCVLSFLVHSPPGPLWNSGWGLACPARGSCPVPPPLVSVSARAGGNPSGAAHSRVSRSRGDAWPLRTLCGGPGLPSPGPFPVTQATASLSDGSEGLLASAPKQQVPASPGASATDGFVGVLGLAGLLALGPGFSPA